MPKHYNKKVKKLEKSMGAEYRAVKKTKRDSKSTVKSHQKDLAKIAGTVAAKKAGKKLPANKNERIAGRNANITANAYDKAKAKTMKSFKKAK
jgi:hypothetical protein